MSAAGAPGAAGARRAAYLPPSVSAREQARRRALLVGIGVLVLLGVSPVVGHHVTQGAAALFQGRDHIGELCLVAVHVLLAPVHGLFHVLLAAGLAYAVADRVRTWWRMRQALSPLTGRGPRPGEPFWVAARQAGIDPRAVRVVGGLPNPAFTIGWITPRIFVAHELAARLSGDELAAVLAHEGAHADRRDPLRLSLLRFFACTLFWIPALRRLAADVADEAEIQADDRAAADEPLVLAAAIVSVAQLAQPHERQRLAGAVGFARHDLLERRVRRLVGEDIPAGTHLTRRSIAGAAAALLLVWVSGTVMAHPLPPASERVAAHGSPENCTRHRGPAVLHVFCDGIGVAGRLRHHCPHTTL